MDWTVSALRRLLNVCRDEAPCPEEIRHVRDAVSLTDDAATHSDHHGQPHSHLTKPVLLTVKCHGAAAADMDAAVITLLPNARHRAPGALDGRRTMTLAAS
jgi:hypothetical protein